MSRVALIGENSIEYVEKMLDIWNHGDCVVLLDWRIPFQTVVGMLDEAGVKTCYVEKKVFAKSDAFVPAWLKINQFESKNNTAVRLPESIYDAFKESYSTDEAVVIYSSGTTGKSKGIILSHYAINTNADAIIDYMEPVGNDCIYIAKSLSHSSTLTGELLVALKTRMALIIAPTIVPPRYVFRNVVLHGVTLLCLNPTLLKMYAEDYAHNHYDISTLRTIYVSGSVLNGAICRTAREVFGGVQICNIYGLSEAGPRVAAQTKDCCTGNSVGRPIKDVGVAIIDDQGNPVESGKCGIIHVDTRSRYSGYISGNEKHRSLFCGWLNTGDIGLFDENGELYVMGRIDDVIMIDSHKVYPSEVEERILQNIDVTKCAVFAVEESAGIKIVCVYAADRPLAAGELRKLHKVLMPYEIPASFIQVDAIPTVVNGKVDYRQLKERFGSSKKHI